MGRDIRQMKNIIKETGDRMTMITSSVSGRKDVARNWKYLTFICDSLLCTVVPPYLCEGYTLRPPVDA